MIVEGGRELANEWSCHTTVRGGEEALSDSLVSLFGEAIVERVCRIGIIVCGDVLLTATVTIVVVDWDARTVDGNLLEVDSLSVDLSVQVGEETTLKERVLAEVNASDDMSGLESDTLGLGEVICRVGVQSHLSKDGNGDKLLRDPLGSIQDIEAECQLLIFIHDLDSKLILRISAVLDSIPKIFAVVVRVLAIDGLGFFPQQTCGALLRLPVPSDELAVALFSDHAHGMNTKATHVTV